MSTPWRASRKAQIAAVTAVALCALLGIRAFQYLKDRTAFSDYGGHMTAGWDHCVELPSWPATKNIAVPPKEVSTLPRIGARVVFVDPSDPDRIYTGWLRTTDTPFEVSDNFTIFSLKDKTMVSAPMDFDLIRKHQKEIVEKGHPLSATGHGVLAFWKPFGFDAHGQRLIAEAHALPKTGNSWGEVTWSPGFKLAMVNSSDQQDSYHGHNYIDIYRTSNHTLLAQVKISRFKTRAEDAHFDVEFFSDRDVLLVYPPDGKSGSALCRFPDEGMVSK